MRVEDVHADDVGRHQVGRELDAVELAADGQGQGPHQQRFRRARRPFQEHVPAGQQGDHRLIQHGVQADDHLGKLAPNGLGGRVTASSSMIECLHNAVKLLGNGEKFLAAGPARDGALGLLPGWRRSPGPSARGPPG